MASSTADEVSAASTFRLWRKTSLQESEKPRGDSTMAPSADQNATGSDFQFGTVATSGARPKFPSGKLGTLHELTEAEKKSRPWWTCQLWGHVIYISNNFKGDILRHVSRLGKSTFASFTDTAKPPHSPEMVSRIWRSEMRLGKGTTKTLGGKPCGKLT